MPSTYSKRVASAFAAGVATYDRDAGLQREIAEKLAARLPDDGVENVLEVGCGTGLLTRHLLRRYRRAQLFVTDLVPEMVDQCRAALDAPDAERVTFAVMDGENPIAEERYDLVALSMTAQWFGDPEAVLRRLAGLLKPGGNLHYATIAPDGFPEWRHALDMVGASEGLIEMPRLPGVELIDTCKVDYGNAIGFLKALKSIGAATPRPGYSELAPGSLRRALKAMDDTGGGAVTWRIAYGRLGPEDAAAP